MTEHHPSRPRCQGMRSRSCSDYRTKPDMRTATLICCTTIATLVVAGCGSGGGLARTLEDSEGDIGAAAAGPDIVAVTVEREADTITFRVRFAAAPPLEVGDQEGWVDMLLVGVDVPPPGPPPAEPGGEWSGADYALGSHGWSASGMLVKLSTSASKKWADVPITIEGATLSVSVPCRALGDPERFALSIAAAREWNETGDQPAGVKPDIAPDTGTWIVELGG